MDSFPHSFIEQTFWLLHILVRILYLFGFSSINNRINKDYLSTKSVDIYVDNMGNVR